MLSFPHLYNAKGRAKGGHLKLLRQQLSHIPPGNEFDLVLFEHLAKGVAGKEVEVALAPRRAPVRMVESRATHLGVVVGEMDHKLSHARFEFPQRVSIELRPVLRRDAGIDGNHMIDENIIRTERSAEKISLREPL